MSDKNDSIKVIKGVDRYKSASSVDYNINTELTQSQNQYTDSDRTISLNLAQVFDDERQSSSIFRPTFKIQYFYHNSYTGYSEYSVFKDSLSYVNALTSLENNDGFWYKKKYDSNGNVIYFEDSDGFWSKKEYDSNGNELYYEDSDGYWSKYEYDSNGNIIYYENSNGKIIDNRDNNI